MADTDKKHMPPYVPYKTFNTFLSHLKAIGVPSHIDKAAMASMSGGMQSWLRSALRYMKLIDAEGVPSDVLHKLVATDANTPERKALLKALFVGTYGFLVGKLDLANTTPPRLRAAIVEQGATGETVEKIVAFLVAMAKDADIPLSKLLTTRAPAQRRPRQTRPATPGRPSPDEDDDGDDTVPSDGVAMKTVALPNAGGTLTLSGNINLFALVGAERELVFAVIDLMRQFELSQEGGEG